jgi:hypothetical protein
MLPGQIGALRRALIGRIEFAEAADETLSDSTLGLIGLGVPQTVIERCGQRVTVVLVALTVADDGIDLALIAGYDPRSIVML